MAVAANPGLSPQDANAIPEVLAETVDAVKAMLRLPPAGGRRPASVPWTVDERLSLALRYLFARATVVDPGELLGLRARGSTSASSDYGGQS